MGQENFPAKTTGARKSAADMIRVFVRNKKATDRLRRHLKALETPLHLSRPETRIQQDAGLAALHQQCVAATAAAK